METLTPKQFQKRLDQLWNKLESEDLPPSLQIQFFTGGNIYHKTFTVLPEEQAHIYSGIIHKPRVKITSQQLCQIFDEGNHCVSTGFIAYENDYCFYSWSNQGHI